MQNGISHGHYQWRHAASQSFKSQSYLTRRSTEQVVEEQIQDPAQPLQAKDWQELEERYEADMAAAIETEASIMAEIENVMKVAQNPRHCLGVFGLTRVDDGRSYECIE